jgi:predicted ATP-grasp superfamily ATP-dependent carboligase
LPSDKVYFQEFLEGQPCAAIYVGEGEGAARQAVLCGVTLQLVGEAWLNARAFHYCGSVGPLTMEGETHKAFQHLGDTLAQKFRLRGLFGVDCILRDGMVFPVEVNPRYTASVEVLEHAMGVSAVRLHANVFDGGRHEEESHAAPQTVGKAILFAREALTVPADGPWTTTLDQPVTTLAAFADLPHAGARIEKGQPLLTVFAQAQSLPACQDELRQRAQSLDRWLFAR